ncbi:DUF4282 domain-containing protein [Thiomicrorhabdus indica]|uniref:DUF4282 domain-containing protein n=1 Tax=Thiomicrorhabdus indica TaxID=2267253 RepID=UPI002AA7210C|nr:DUF4282 domain-containing protein [Thiomicrorhabdus indica]
MFEFLSFQTLISQQALILFYYLGAVIMPIFLFLSMRKLVRVSPSLQAFLTITQAQLSARLSFSSRLKLGLMFVVIFLLMELFWRMLFEFLIAFMQMRDALVIS